MVKPNCTITTRQDALLNELANTRFASRSEALRTAIEELHQSIKNDAEQPIEQVLTEVKALDDKMGDINDRLESLKSNSIRRVRVPRNQVLDSESDRSNVDQPSEQDDKVYSAIHELEFALETDIAEECNLRQLDVHQSLQRLVSADLVSTLEDDRGTLYRPAPPST